jgi:hypothetical protein
VGESGAGICPPLVDVPTTGVCPALAGNPSGVLDSLVEEAGFDFGGESGGCAARHG